MLILIKADPTAKKQSYKRNMISDQDANIIKMVFVLLEGTFDDLRINENWL